MKFALLIIGLVAFDMLVIVSVTSEVDPDERNMLRGGVMMTPLNTANDPTLLLPGPASGKQYEQPCKSAKLPDCLPVSASKK